jgi:hypothetical protein
MPHAALARMATRDRDAGRYQRHRPEKGTEANYPDFNGHLLGHCPRIEVSVNVGVVHMT